MARLFVNMGQLRDRLRAVDGLVVPVEHQGKRIGTAEVMFRYDQWGAEVSCPDKGPDWITNPYLNWLWYNTVMRVEEER